ncbi:hypothetical protein [Polymorphum gilvum]|uniref:Uncharacterized protein n=1 Tax=Polymorphum gilvum (strain LMG 25793 / CGMCC 1.9160 / SL003B-26A1) TaxID=991905 RepID=F2IY36_POLGS|nr:hypothetical protein [Polymorphum gilvum]ADZ70539.1 hypothetical protein SL003B_2114 [Polymorphum gilvum SL003B-26A1]
MSGLRFEEFVQRFWSDERFRRAFAKDPRRKLKEYGFDPDLFDIPEQFDMADLEAHLERRRAAAEHPPAGLDRMTAAEAWRAATMLPLARDVAELAQSMNMAVVTTQSSSVTTALVYGTTATTQTQVALTSTGTGAGLKAETLARLQALRALARRPAADLTVSVRLADGRTVDGLSVDAARALIERRR